MANENKNDNIVVEKSQIDKLLEHLQKQDEKIKMLESIADKNELAKYMEKSKDKTKRSCRVRCLRDDKGERVVVTSWDNMVTNEVWQNQNGISVAKQVVKVHTEDGKEIIGDLLDVGRRYEYISAEKVGEKKNEAGNTIWTVKAENGKTYEIGLQFIN